MGNVTEQVRWNTMPLWTLLAVDQAGGEAANSDIADRIGQLAGIDTDGDKSSRRLALVRTDLKKRGLLANTNRGVWGLTPLSKQMLKSPMNVLGDALSGLEETIHVPEDAGLWVLLALHRAGGAASGDDVRTGAERLGAWNSVDPDHGATVFDMVAESLQDRNLVAISDGMWQLTETGLNVLSTADPTNTLTQIDLEPDVVEEEIVVSDTPDGDTPDAEGDPPDSEPEPVISVPTVWNFGVDDSEAEGWALEESPHRLPWLQEQVNAAEEHVLGEVGDPVVDQFASAMRVFDRVALASDPDYLPSEQEHVLRAQFDTLMGTYGRVKLEPVVRLILAQLWHDRNMPTEEERARAAAVFCEHAPTLAQRWSLTRESFELFGVPGDVLDAAGIYNSMPFELSSPDPELVEPEPETDSDVLFVEAGDEFADLTPEPEPEEPEPEEEDDWDIDDPFADLTPEPEPEEPEPEEDDDNDDAPSVPGFMLDDEEVVDDANPFEGETAGDLADLFPHADDTERLGFYNSEDLTASEVEVTPLTKKPGLLARLRRWWRNLDPKNRN